jgi:sugar phosphate isomerase/epimerase
MRVGFMMPFNLGRIAFARAHGFGCAELVVQPGDPFFPGNKGWRERAQEVKETFGKAGIRISCLAAFYINHMDPKQAAEGRKRVRGSIQLAQRLGVRAVAGFAGRITGRLIEESLPQFKKIWSEHAAFAEDHGVRIAIENCPMGWRHLPGNDGINCMSTPEMWRRGFEAVPSSALGLEWDPSHLVCQFIDPIANLREFGSKAHHVHAKDAHINRDLLEREGVWADHVAEHSMPGLGDVNWGLVIKELQRQGYRGDLNIEGWHDAVYRDQERGPKLEDKGLLIALHTLAPFVDGK